MIAFCIFDSCETWDTELSLCFLKLSFLQLTWHNCTDKKENHNCEVNTTALVWLDITNVPSCVAVPNYKTWHRDLYEDFLWRNIWALKRPCTEMSYLSAKTSSQLFSFQNGVTFFLSAFSIISFSILWEPPILSRPVHKSREQWEYLATGTFYRLLHMHSEVKKENV